MSQTVIRVENLSKQYRLGQVGRRTLHNDINRFWYRVRGKGDPYLKIGEENDRSKKRLGDYVWALQDINFEVQQGAVLGIIGKNGAGKSTLLKILSKVTAPSTGNVKIRGKIASLLEVGTGFHPDLSGRDNIFLNGAILGMTKKEIQNKFDAIVDFAGVERYIDTPVKRYSSGMYVRLAFAVAAHLEPDILIVDEVLAVGDAEFQKKCLGKMKEVSVNQGRTVLFVSHNLQAINKICDRGILIKNGQIEINADIATCIKTYLSTDSNMLVKYVEGSGSGDSSSYITSIAVFAKDKLSGIAGIEDEIKIVIEYLNFKENRVLNLSVAVYDEQGNYAFSSPSNDSIFSLKPHKNGMYKATLSIPPNLFNSGNYYFTVLLVENGTTILCELEKILKIEMHANNIDTKGFFGSWGGILRPVLGWEIEKRVD